MGKPKISRVRHGMASCARYGCRRIECLEAKRKAHREAIRDAKNGIRAHVPPDEAAVYAKTLMRAGMSPGDIADRSGVSLGTVKEIVGGRVNRIYWVTEDAILGVQVPEGDWTRVADGVIGSAGTTRRLQALSVQGFPLSFLTERTGLAKSTVGDLRAGTRQRVMISGMCVVRDVHDRFWDENPVDHGLTGHVVGRTQRWAEKYGWLPTEVWDDIDDPECKPVLGTPRYVILAENARELIEQQDYTKKAAAERLGVKPHVLAFAMGRYEKAMSA